VSTVVSSQAVRIPPGVEHSAVLVSTNGVPVVAERTVAAASPSALSGLGELPGGELAANKWLLPYFPGDATHTGRVVVFNPSATPAQVSVADVDGSPQLGTMTVAAGRWSALPLSNLQPIAGRPLLLTASQPVYVEADYYGRSPTTGVSLSFGVPLNP
jgi:hypothetical protein